MITDKEKLDNAFKIIRALTLRVEKLEEDIEIIINDMNL